MKFNTRNHLTTHELVDLLLGIFAFGISLSIIWAKPFCLWMEGSNLLTVVGWLLTVSFVSGIAMAKLNSGAEHGPYLMLLGAQLGFLSSVVTLGILLPHTNYHIVFGVGAAIIGWVIGVILSASVGKLMTSVGKLAYNAFWLAFDVLSGDFEQTAHPPR